jgi:(1->4)-alpha-D-glucan 1-alpha-D-glucosylmutase
VRVPSGTYRVQFHLSFRFADAEALVPYLHELGISDLYSSPPAKARRGSSHGYDVADPMRINSELGTEEEFGRLVDRLHKYEMALLADIVPNHMAASMENPWWADVLENGRDSPFAAFFDIDWRASASKAPAIEKNRIVLPMLTDFYYRVLLNQGLLLGFDEKGFFVHAESNRIPISVKTYGEILRACSNAMEEKDDSPESRAKLAQFLTDLKQGESSAESGDKQHANVDMKARAHVKAALWRLYLDDKSIHDAIDEALRAFNGSKGDARSFDPLDGLLTKQSYRLAHWRTATDEVNYRRFFALNDLVGIRIEDPRVFEATHARVFRMVADDKIAGLRVDHIDGLRDPLEYLTRLQDAHGPHASDQGGALNTYTVVEKITSGTEPLPYEWPVAGTTGYDFMNAVNTLFVDPRGSAELERIYEQFTGIRVSFTETWYVRKKQVIEEMFRPDVALLGNRLGRLAVLDRLGRDLPMGELLRAMKEITARLSIYRTYCRGLELSNRDRTYLGRAFQIARERTQPDAVSDDTWAFLHKIFLLEDPPANVLYEAEWLEFIFRWQQFTGAVMAKGFEDTAFFVHHGLLSLNEVGCNPFRRDMRFGLQGFHQFNKRRLKEYPATMNATSTHDSKWSEDVRARINVLSEIPREWNIRLHRWAEMNKSKKTDVNGRLSPSANEEVLLYQSMLGIWPVESLNLAELKPRLESFMQKAAREAKTHSSWVSPNEHYEQAIRNFIEAILDEASANAFLPDFAEFFASIAVYGACNGYAQTLLKLASPGVPDFFQGTELWKLSLTDPDNRTDVDFRERMKIVEEFRLSDPRSLPCGLCDLLKQWPDGRLKLFLTQQMLLFRKAHRELFLKGDYVPLESIGKHEDSVCAFARRLERSWVIVAAPRLVTKVVQPPDFPLGHAWDSTAIVLPSQAPANWTSLFTQKECAASSSGGKKTLAVAELFATVPFAVLFHESQS